jgi:hypothetical protein
VEEFEFNLPQPTWRCKFRRSPRTNQSRAEPHSLSSVGSWLLAEVLSGDVNLTNLLTNQHESELTSVWPSSGDIRFPLAEITGSKWAE